MNPAGEREGLSLAQIKKRHYEELRREKTRKRVAGWRAHKASLQPKPNGDSIRTKNRYKQKVNEVLANANPGVRTTVLQELNGDRTAAGTGCKWRECGH